MRKIILKLRIMLLKHSIKAWAKEMKKETWENTFSYSIMEKEQSQRYWQLAQLEQQHDTI